MERKTIVINTTKDIKEVILEHIKEGWIVTKLWEIDRVFESKPPVRWVITLEKDNCPNFTKEELQHIKDHLDSSFRGYVCSNSYYEGEAARDLESSIKKKLHID